MNTYVETLRQNGPALVVVGICLAALLYLLSDLVKKKTPLQWQPNPYAVRALAIYASISSVMVLAAGFAAYYISNDLLGIIAVVGGIEACADVLKRADSLGTVRAIEPPAPIETSREI